MGFFTKQETQSVTRPDGKVFSCHSCGLYRGPIRHPKLQASGKFKKKILNIGEFTTSSDDKTGKHFSGTTAAQLRKEYKRLGIALDKDCLNVNAVMCSAVDKKTERYRLPNSHEIDCCRINIIQLIKEVKPKLIVLHGKIATQSVIKHTWGGNVGKFETWRGWVIPDQTFKCFIAPVYAPSFAVNEKRPELSVIWRQDLERALKAIKIDFPVFKQPKIKEIKNLDVLKKIKNNATVSFDYETTGLKPHRKGHKIVCASLAVSADLAYVFMMPKKKKKRKPFLDILTNKYIKKMAHNMKFEHSWSLNILGVFIKGWFWDSMIAAHVLDNRPGITGLKFQTYVRLGLPDYSKEVGKWLQAKDANSHNKLLEFVSRNKGKQVTLTYCGFDSIVQWRVAEQQREEVANASLPF